MFLTIIILAIYSIIWGFATNKVIKNKYYKENWFWWGFFFGFIAFIVACTKPENPNKTKDEDSTPFKDKGWICLKCGTKNPIYTLTCECGYTREGNHNANLQRNNSWQCKKCGKIVANYIGTCACGNTKDANIALENKSILESSKESIDDLERIKQYKELLDLGIITPSEFELKKKQLLKL